MTFFSTIGWAILSILPISILMCMFILITYLFIDYGRRHVFVTYETGKKIEKAMVYLVIGTTIAFAICLNRQWIGAGKDGLYHLLFYIISVVPSLFLAMLFGTLAEALLIRR